MHPNADARLALPPSSSHRYDAIVIGAGMAGLTAAAFLAQAGARVLVCEQSAGLGGLFTSFRRDGYLFDAGIKAVENSAVLLPTLSLLGLLEEVDLVPSPVAVITDGKVQPIRGFADIEAHFRHLESLFPGEQAGLQRLLQDVRTVYLVLDAALRFPIPFFQPKDAGSEPQKQWMRNHGSMLARLPGAALLMRTDLRGHLRRRLTDPRLVNLLSHLFPEGTSAFFGLGYWRMFLDYYYPRGGVQALPDALGRFVTAAGGRVRRRAPVGRVLLAGGSAVGVRLVSGEEITAGYVVAACDLRQALTRLCPADVLPDRFARRLSRARVSHSVVNLFLGLNLPPDRVKVDGCPHVFYSPDLEGITDEDRVGRADYFAHVPQEISIPCLHDPSLAPPGKTGLIVSAMASWHFGSGWEGGPAEYAALKERCAREMIGALEPLIPGLAEHIELSLFATPRTIAAHTANTEGAIMGWSYRRGRGLSRGNFLQIRDCVRTPVPRLLTAGHWSFAPGGSPVAVLTGKLAAEHILTNRGE